MPPVKAVMTPFPHPVGVDEPITTVQRVMAERRIRHLPVMERGKLVGVISARDIKQVIGPAGEPPSGQELLVRDLCIFDAYVVDLNEPLANVLLEMASRDVDSALVVKDKRLAGIFTVADACRAFGECLRALDPKGGGEDAA